MDEKQPYVTEINGVQVFSANFVFKQMQAQGHRIDRAKRIAGLAVLVAVASLIVGLIF